MKKNLFLTVIATLVVILALAGCGKKTTAKPEVTTKAPVATTVAPTTKASVSTTEAQPQELNLTINVYDFDGKVLGHKELKAGEGDTVLSLLNANFTVDSNQGQYGTNLVSINGSFTGDSSWSLMIYENNEMAATGVDGLVIDEGDVFDFKVECWNTVESGWGTLDQVDVNLEKAVFKYLRDELPEVVQSVEAWNGSTYWEMLTVIMLENAGMPIDVKVSDALKTSLNVTIDETSITSAADWGKYYSHAKVAGIDMAAFETQYKKYLAGTFSETESKNLPSEYPAYGEYSMPFALIPATEYGKDASGKIDHLLEAAMPGTDWGFDAYNWVYVEKCAFGVIDKTLLSTIAANQAENGVSQALNLLSFAAAGVNPRAKEDDTKKYAVNGLDPVEYLMNNFYDAELNIVKWSSADTDYVASSNQIYASLIAYYLNTICGKKACLFNTAKPTV